MQQSPRISVVDALRGFAVLAILLVHNIEHFIYAVYPLNAPSWLNTLDIAIHDVVFAVFAGKAYAIFALLFGLTFWIQYSNQKTKGNDFGGRFLWRLVLLIVFATINAAFFPAGDVLLLFAIVALVLFLTRKWNNRSILFLAFICLLQPIEWFNYFMTLFNSKYQMPDLQVGPMYTRMEEITKSGSLSDFFFYNVTLGQKASFLWAVDAGRLIQTAGLFLLGTYLGRSNIFLNTSENTSKWVNILIVSAVLLAPLYALSNQISNSEVITQKTVGIALNMWQNLSYTLVLVSFFILLYNKVQFFNSLFSKLIPYGKMSLTNYLSQSIIGAIIYFPIGLNLAPYCGFTISFLIGIVTFILQLKFSQWWLKKHKQGPLESIWHKWTWIKKK